MLFFLLAVLISLQIFLQSLIPSAASETGFRQSAFSGYTSKPLKDFIYESNNGKDVFFVGSEQEAVERLTQAG